MNLLNTKLRWLAQRASVFSAVAISLLLLSAPSCLAAAQELNGQIRGTVTDAQGAVVPGAKVAATHVATNTVYNATTTGSGVFTIPNVRLGLYNVTAEATGFRRTLVQNVSVETGQIADVKITLQVGAAQEEITVTAEAAQEILNQANAELSAVVDEKRVLESPLNGRNASHLLLMQAGVYFERDADGQGDKLLIHGRAHRALSISLDGMDTQDNTNRASSIMLDQPLIQLTAENVQEFKVVTGLGTAETGRGGAHISAVTRAGGNKFHGATSWFHRNTVFNANEFFNNAAQPKVERPPLLRNQFAGRLSGPIFKNRHYKNLCGSGSLFQHKGSKGQRVKGISADL